MTLLQPQPSLTKEARALQLREGIELIDRVSRGDSEALGELYDRFSGMLLALASRILGDLADAEDVVQECFFEVWHKADRYDPSRASVSTWLVLITRSRAIDHMRRRSAAQRRNETAHRLDPRDKVESEGAAGVLHSERRRRIRALLQRLPAKQREVLDLTFYGGLTNSEIADQTGIPLGTVKTRVLLGMKKLRRALRAEIGDLL